MRVGFDVSPLARPHPPGLVRVVRSLVAALERRRVLEVVRLVPPGGAGLLRWRQEDLALASRRLGLIGVHSFVSALPLLGGGARVQTLHELPWLHGERENAGLRHRLWAWLGPRRARAVMTATERTAQDIRREAPDAAERVRVCPWGLDGVFAAAPQADDVTVLERLGLAAGAYVVCPGGVRPKKNLAALLRGVAEHERRGGTLEVVSTGAADVGFTRNVELARALGLRRAPRALGMLSDTELAALLRQAAAVAVLSLSEGFGLGALEALGCGTPVLVTRGSAQAEVAGAGGIEVEPSDAAAVAGALKRARCEREALSAAGRARAQGFTWDASAAIVEGVWEELA